MIWKECQGEEKPGVHTVQRPVLPMAGAEVLGQGAESNRVIVDEEVNKGQGTVVPKNRKGVLLAQTFYNQPK